MAEVPEETREQTPGELPPGSAVCDECGRVFAASETIVLSGRRACAACKPVLLQRISEGAELGGNVPYAGFWVRVLAYLLDGLILFAVNTMISFVMAPITFAMSDDPVKLLPIYGVLWLLQIGTQVGYETWFIGKKGATPGKMATRMRVVRGDGQPVTYGRAFGRYCAKLLNGCTMGIGFVIAAFDDERRTLHDRLCDTRVVRMT